MQLVTRWFWLRHAPILAHKGVFIGKGNRNNDPAAELDYSHREIALLASRISGVISDITADNVATSSILRENILLPCLLITSTLRRARETATALIDAEPQTYKAMRVMRIAAFDEQNFGAFEGKEYDMDEQRALWDAPDTYRPPEGESFTDLIDRVARALERIELALLMMAKKRDSVKVAGEITGKVANASIVVVAHAGTIRAAIAHALTNSRTSAAAQALTFAIDTLSCTRIDTYRDDALGVAKTNSENGESKRHSLIGCVNARWGLAGNLEREHER